MDDPSKFTYMCPSCQSFQKSDVPACLKCGAENPHLAGEESREDPANETSMSQAIDISPVPQPSESLSWLQVWRRALTVPSVITFEQFVHDPNATTRRAFSWMFVAYFVGYGLSFLIHKLTQGSSLTETIGVLVLGLSFGGLLSVLVIIVITEIKIASSLLSTCRTT